MEDTFDVYVRALDEYFKAITQTLISSSETLYRDLDAKITAFRVAMAPKSKDALEATFIWFYKVRLLVRANEDIVPTLCNEKLLSQLALVTTPTKVELLEKMRTILADSYAAIMRRYEDTQHTTYESMATDADRDRIAALTEKYGNKDLLVASLRNNRDEGRRVIIAEIDAELTAVGVNVAFPPNDVASLPGSDLIFDINPLLNAKYILDHGLDMVSPASGIDRRAIDATRTITAGVTKVDTDYADWTAADVRIEKAIAQCLTSAIMDMNKSPITLDALLALDLENTRRQRASQTQYRGLQRAKLESGTNVLDTVESATLYDMWRYKEVKNVYVSYLRSKSRHEAIRMTVRSRQYGINDTPMSAIYEREVASKHFE